MCQRSKARSSQHYQNFSGLSELLGTLVWTYDEIRKRCDVWELFIDAQNVAHLNTGDRERKLRVNLNSTEDADIERFAMRTGDHVSQPATAQTPRHPDADL